MEREEGELTDEDLEDVSDNSSELSIPIALTGKSPLREPFRELSLTSISDDSDSLLLEKTTYRHISRDLYRKHSHKHRRQDLPSTTTTKRARKFSEKRVKRRDSIHRKDYSSVSSSSDDSNYKNKRILRQLRDAVRINHSQNLPNCSLRTRLKRMIEPASASPSPSSNSSDDDNLEILRDQALQSKTKSDANTKPTTENTVTDEDLAQLRLIALKSAVIKKHAERRKRKEEQLKQQAKAAQEEKPETPNDKEKPNENPDNNKSIEEDEDILRAMLLTSISKKIADKKTQPLPNNKPNGITQKPENNYKLPVNQPINRFIINVNSDSDSDSEHNESNKLETKTPKPLNPKNDIFDKSLSLFLQQARAKTEQDKTKHQSDISHLPRSQQIEYKRLKRKLQILSTRMKPPNKMKKIATNSLSTPDENKKLINNLNTNVNNKTNKFVVAQQGVTEKPRKDERLMIKGKYEELTPLMSRVSEARNARDKTQAEVKRLINNLKIARAQLTANHQEYTLLVQELVRAKTDIDKRADMQQKKNNRICTSTPNKILKVQENNVVSSTNEEISIATPPPPKIQIEQPEPVQQQQQQQDVIENKLEKEIEPQPPEPKLNDMMDIDEIVPELNDKKEATILKYNSPLEHIQISRKQPLQNPLLELCPYDLLGVCRDADCAYQHCGGSDATSGINITNITNTNTNNTLTK